jgi:hypothetical protein
LKIALISFLYGSNLGGGAARVVEVLAEGLSRAGNDVSVITSGRSGKGISVLRLRIGVKIYPYFPS